MANKLMKNDIVNSVVEKTGLPVEDAGAAVDAFISTIQESLKEGIPVGVIGFGIFEVRTRAARDGRNPQTGEKMRIEAKRVPAFRAGKKLKDAVA